MPIQEIQGQVKQAMLELLEVANLEPDSLVVVGCSSSEIAGQKIGTASVPEIGAAVLRGIMGPLSDAGIWLAAQCCEHLNRALVVEWQAVQLHGLERVNVVPQPKAGGSFATAAWQAFETPAVVEQIVASAGIDIGNTLIGMHLRQVAVPVRLNIRKIGQAPLVCARTRPKFIGGARAIYDEALL